MERFIDPKTLARVKDMPLIAKTVADGFLHGLQSSQQRGVGIEFSQYRSYEPGDDLARIDWKLFGRSDRYFVREAERESETTLWLLLDASLSMNQQSESSVKQQGWNKFDYGRHIVATLAYLAHRQGDSVGFIGLSSEKLSFIPARSGESNWHNILRELAAIKTGATFPNAELIKNHLSGLQKSGLIFVISDFHQINNEINTVMKQISHSHNEVVALQLQCQDEVLFPYKGAIRFQDLETKEEILVSASSAKHGYQQALAQYQEALTKQLSQLNVSHNPVNIDQPLDQVLFDYLNQRIKVVR